MPSNTPQLKVAAFLHQAWSIPLNSSLWQRDVSGTKLNGADFPDPSIIEVDSTWYAFATTSNNKLHIQVASSPDFETWTLRSGYDALPYLPPWVDATAPNTWAPDVNQVDDGSFVMYYAAATAEDSSKHCTGAATASQVTGPYMPNGNGPLECAMDMGGAIDPSGFRDTDGTRYLTYKIDGNSIGHGGSCNNGIPPIIETPIMLQQLDADGITKVGPARTILVNQPADGPLIEAPSLTRAKSGEYVLFYSSNCYTSTQYDVAYAVADSITGPYTRVASLFQSTSGLVSPGGADIDADGTHMLFHANVANGRGLFTAMIDIDSGKVTA
ncbi:MAG: hypothetical protein M1820_007694 [Bogoriella megaspora]|nr:MAG: hypothetical protein M1820_007694 [Bogoriella megaspora]